MEETTRNHRQSLVEEAAEVLNRYTPFASHHRVCFAAVDREGEDWPWLAARLDRRDGTPMGESKDPLDQKLSHLTNQTALVRPFFLPMAKSPWKEDPVNAFQTPDFDYGAILGYGLTPEGAPFLKALYFAPTDALLERQAPDADGMWRLPLATYYVHRLSLDPRKNFARFLYLAERMTEALEYQYDKMGRFYSET